MDKPLPLAGVKVLEFSHTIMGPSCGIVLADLGADVIKIEPPQGEHTRRLAGFAAGFFTNFNRNKRSLAVDLKSPAGRDLIHRLIPQVDVVLENFAPGTMDRLDCGYATLARMNPRLIYCALKGFLSGPYQQRQALDEVVQFMGGLAYMTGPRGRPLRAGSSVIDILAGTFGATAILAALRERESTGRGQQVQSALFESTVWLMGQHMAGEAICGAAIPPMPERWGAWAIYQTFATADADTIFIGITSNNHWQRFCGAFERPDLLADPSLASNEDRIREQDRLLPIVADIVAKHTKSEMLAICERINIPFAPVAQPGDLFDDPHLNEGGRLVETRLPDGSGVKLPLLPIEMGEHDLGLRQQPPQAGEHSREVLAEFGLDEAAIDALFAAGTIR